MSIKSKCIPEFPERILKALHPPANYFITHANLIIEQLNGLSSKLPQRYGWRFRTAEAFDAEAESIGRSASDMFPINVLYWKDILGNCEAYSLMNTWRMIDLAHSGVLALAQDDSISASLLARSALETAAQFVDFARRISATLGLITAETIRPGSPLDPAIDLHSTGLASEDLDKYLLQTIFASRLPDVDELYKPTNIITIIDRINKSPGQEVVRPAYDILCEVAHPNFLGRSLYLLNVERGPRTIGPGNGPSKQLVIAATVTAISWACATQVTAFDCMS
jgi:hypothetical protein